jgi:hypothetical protein
MKHCPKCNTDRDESEFYDKTPTRKQSYCKPCHNAYTMQRWTQRKKDAVIYLGSTCKHCNNEYHHAAMQFHHLDPLSKDCEWTKLRLKSWDSVKLELDKCILLCANCHSILHSNT